MSSSFMKINYIFTDQNLSKNFFFRSCVMKTRGNDKERDDLIESARSKSGSKRRLNESSETEEDSLVIEEVDEDEEERNEDEEERNEDEEERNEDEEESSENEEETNEDESEDETQTKTLVAKKSRYQTVSYGSEKLYANERSRVSYHASALGLRQVRGKNTCLLG